MKIVFLILGLYYLQLQANCTYNWVRKENGCQVYLQDGCKKNNKLVWDGKCKNSKADGDGILKWNDDVNFSNKDDNQKYTGYYLGTFKNGKLDEGVYIDLLKKEIYIGEFNVDLTHNFQGVIYKEEKEAIIIGKADSNNLLNGEAFIGYLKKNIYEHGFYKNSERKNVLISYLVASENKKQCTIVTAIADKTKTEFQNSFNGLCSIRADMKNALMAYIDQEQVYVFKKNTLYIFKANDMIQVGTFKNNKLEGKGIVFSSTFVSKGIFHNGTLTQGKTIHFSQSSNIHIGNRVK